MELGVEPGLLVAGDDLERLLPALVLAREPGDAALGLLAQAVPEPLEPLPDLRVGAAGLRDEPAGAVDPLLGEDPGEPGRIDAGEEVVEADVLRVLRAVGELDRAVSRGRRRPRPPPRT